MSERPDLARHPARGFSLLEIMIAVTVIGVSLMGMAQLLGVAIQQNHLARFNTTAVEIARGQLEALKAQYDAELSSGVASSSLTAGSHGPDTVTVGQAYGADLANQVLNVSWDVVNLGGQQKQVTVTVKPQGISDPERSAMVRKTIRISMLLAP